MKSIRNLALATQVILLSCIAQANDTNSSSELSRYTIDLSFEDMRQVIESMALKSLKSDSSAPGTNCQHNRHCVALPYDNGCKIATFSTYDSTSIENTIQELTLLHDFDLKPNKICKKIEVGGQCSSTRCVFGPRAAANYN